MSYTHATKSLHLNHVLTSLKLIGGNDITTFNNNNENINIINSNGCDLVVEGGCYIGQRTHLDGKILSNNGAVFKEPVKANIIGCLLGDVQGNIIGDLIGNVYGSVIGNVIGNVYGSVNGDLYGNLYGDSYGNVINSNYIKTYSIKSINDNLNINDVIINNGIIKGDLIGNVECDILTNNNYIKTNKIIENNNDYGIEIECVLARKNEVIISGNVIVLGSTNFLETGNTIIRDNILILNHGEIGSGVSGKLSGIEIDRGNENNYQFLFNESNKSFQIGEINDLQTVATRESNPNDKGLMYWNDSNYQLESSEYIKVNNNLITADINGNITGDINSSIINVDNYIKTDKIISNNGLYIDDIFIKNNVVHADFEGDLKGNVTGNITGNFIGNFDGTFNGTFKHNIITHISNDYINSNYSIHVLSNGNRNMKIKSNLTDFIGKIYYFISDESNIHSITIETPGTWDGKHNTVRFLKKSDSLLTVIGLNSRRFLILNQNFVIFS